MVAKANKTAAALPNMTAMVADAQNLHAFGDNSFDVVCNNSIHVAKFHKLMVCKLKNVHQPKLWSDSFIWLLKVYDLFTLMFSNIVTII